MLENYLTQEGVNFQNQQLKSSLEKKICDSNININTYQSRISLLSSYDFETENDGCVTVRDRDTMQQVRIPLGEVKAYINERLKF